VNQHVLQMMGHPMCVCRILLCAWLLLLAGCTREPAPEEHQADQIFKQAKESFSKGKYRETRDLLRSANEMNRRLDRTRQVAEGYELLGRMYVSAAEFDSAMSFVSASLEQYRRLADRASVRALTLELASLHSLMGDDRRAFDIYTEAMRLAQLFEEDDGVREIRWAMLPAARALGKTELETQILASLTSAYAASGDRRQLARVHLEAGTIRLARRQYQAALEDLLRGLSLSEQARDSLLAIESLLQIARTYVEMGSLTEAFDTFTDALRRSDITQGAGHLREEMLARVGNIYMHRGQPSEALRFYRAALASAIKRRNRIAEGYLFIQVGHCELAQPGGREAAMRSFRAALDVFNDVRLPRGIAYAQASLGYASLLANQPVQAIEYFKGAVDHHEMSHWRRPQDDLYVECEETFFSKAGESYYDMVIEQLLHMGRNDDAFWYMGRQLAREMFEVLSAWELTSRRDDVTNALAEFRRARGIREGVERQLARLASSVSEEPGLIGNVQANLEPAARAMAAAAERVLALDPSLEPALRSRGLTLAEVQKLLPQRTVLLTHFAGRRTLHVFAVTSSRAAVQVAAVGRDRVVAMTREFASLLRERESYGDSSDAQRRSADTRIRELTTTLYAFFVRPVDGDIAEAAQVIVVPARELIELPLHALSRTSARTDQHMIQRYAVTYLPVTTALTLPSKMMRPERTVVGVGHPGDTRWDVEYELRDIRAFYRDATLHFDQQATLETLHKDSADVLHLALAFRRSSDHPGTMHVLLSDGKSTGTTREVQLGRLFSLPRNPAVIVSNLDGSSRIDRSIALLFLMRGSEVVIMSQYPPTRKTRKFFGEVFYTSLLGGADGRWAFRATQLEMIKNREYASIHHWAPYTVWGK
jgi:tetratricopeptide (TPR) repeat protein